MNLPIRSEPPVLDLPAPTRTPNRSAKPGERGNFADVLNQELDGVSSHDEEEKEPPTEKKESTKNTVDAWTLYGGVSIPVQIAVPTKAPSAESQTAGGTTNPEGKVPAPAISEEQTSQSTQAKSPDASPPINEGGPPLSAIPLDLLSKLEKPPDPLKVAENLENSPSTSADSAENALKPAKEASKTSGILAAQEEIMLLPSQKQDEIAASGKGHARARNDLSIVPNANPAQVEVKQAAVELRKIPVVDEALSEKRIEQPLKIDFSPTESFPVKQQHADSIAPSELTPTRTTSVDSVVETLHNHVKLLRYSGVDRMEVIFRPDQDTQLFIQVAKVNGEIQIQARWERGDLNHVAAQWSQVQQSLANQGIRVEPLQYSSPASFANTNFSGQKQQSGRDYSSGTSAATNHLNSGQKKSSATSGTAKTSPVRKSGNGWQSWA